MARITAGSRAYSQGAGIGSTLVLDIVYQVSFDDDARDLFVHIYPFASVVIPFAIMYDIVVNTRRQRAQWRALLEAQVVRRAQIDATEV